MKTSIPRIRSVTEKATGRQLRVLRHHIENDRKSIDARLQALMNNFYKEGTSSAGFAFVLWDKAGQSMTACSVFDTNAVPRAMMPDFVRNLLMINVTKDW